MPKPLLFGDATLDSDRIDGIRAIDAVWDRSYVPGYSEARRANELAVRDGKKPIGIPRYQWIRLGTADGREVGDKDMLEWALMGYKFATLDDVKAHGYGMPPTAYVDAQGRIRREDLALAFVDEAQARKNAERQARINAEAHGSQPGTNAEIAYETRTDDVADLATLGARYVRD